MNARTLTTATFFNAFAGVFTTFAVVFTASAADSQLLSMVMPDAKVVAGVNVDSAKASPFGLYVLTQMQSNNTDLQQLIALTGFDPTRDVHELLAATDATPGGKTPTGLVLARGNFDPATITTLAIGKGAATEVYNSVTIIENPQKVAGIAFLNSTLVIAGDVANIKAAIDRPGTGQSLPSSVMSQISQWSGTTDAWIITTVPLSTLAPAAGAGGGAAGNPMGNPMAGVMQQIQQMSGGVKFGNSVVGTAAIQADNATDATQLAQTMQFLVNLLQMQSQKDAKITALAQGFTVNAQGTTVNVTVTLPEAQFQQLFQMEKKAAAGSPHAGRN
jgi:hypothetical protein